MIAVDTNVVVYAHKQGSPFHSQAKTILAGLAESPAPWAIPWTCLHEFYAVVTHPRLYAPASPPDEAAEQIQARQDRRDLPEPRRSGAAEDGPRLQPVPGTEDPQPDRVRGSRGG